MSKKLKTKYQIDIENVLERAKYYPFINQTIKSQLVSLKQLTSSPLVEQVHMYIDLLNRYTDHCKHLLTKTENILQNLQQSHIENIDLLLDKVQQTINKSDFRSVDSEILLLNFFLEQGISCIEYEPYNKNLRNKMDVKLEIEDKEIFIELITPNYPEDDFEEEQNYLFEKLERINSGYVIEVSGFELYDSENLWQQKTTPPTYEHIDEILSNFRKKARNLSSEDLPLELTNLSPNYKKIKFKVVKQLTDNELKNLPEDTGTVVCSSSSRSGEGFPLQRIIKQIDDEKKHFDAGNINFVVVDYSYWNVVEFHYLNNEIYGNKVTKQLKDSLSSKINGVFTFISGNKEYPILMNKRKIYLDPTVANCSAVKNYINIWK